MREQTLSGDGERVERAKDRYVRGELTEAEFEAAVERELTTDRSHETIGYLRRTESDGVSWAALLTYALMLTVGCLGLFLLGPQLI